MVPYIPTRIVQTCLYRIESVLFCDGENNVQLLGPVSNATPHRPHPASGASQTFHRSQAGLLVMPLFIGELVLSNMVPARCGFLRLSCNICVRLACSCSAWCIHLLWGHYTHVPKSSVCCTSPLLPWNLLNLFLKQWVVDKLVFWACQTGFPTHTAT